MSIDSVVVDKTVRMVNSMIGLDLEPSKGHHHSMSSVSATSSPSPFAYFSSNEPAVRRSSIANGHIPAASKAIDEMQRRFHEDSHKRDEHRSESTHAKLVDDACRQIAVAAAVAAKSDESNGSANGANGRRRRRGGIVGFKELAAKAGLSPWHFHRVFRSLTGITPKAYGDACWNAVSKVESSSPTATSSSSPATTPMVFGIGSKRSASDSLDSDSDHLFKRIHYGAEEVSASPLSQSMSPATGLPLEVMDTPATTLGSLDSLDTPLEAPAPIAPAPGVDDLDTLASLGPAPALDGFALDPWQSLLSPETNAVPSVSDSESNSPMSETFRDPILTSDELQMAPQMARPDAFGPLDCNLMDPLNVQKPSANWDLNFDDSVMPMRFTDESLSIMPPFEPSTVDYSSILD